MNHNKLILLIVTIFLVILLSITSGRVFCQRFYLDGNIEDTSADSIVINVCPYYSYYRGEADAKKFYLPVKNHYFKLSTELQSDYSYISVYSKVDKQFRLLIRLFLITSGDIVHVNIKKNMMLFNGKGAEKYNCQFALENVPENHISQEELRSFKNTTTDLKFNMFVKKRKDSLTEVKLGLLDHYKNLLKPQTFELLKINVIAESWFQLYNNISLNFKYDPDENEIAREDKIRFFYELEKYQLPPNLNSVLLAHSSSAPDYLIRKAAQEKRVAWYLNKIPGVPNFDPLIMARNASRRFGELLKERMYVECFNAFYRPRSHRDESELETALSETQNPYFHDFLFNLKQALNYGRKAFNFTLTNQWDQKVSLSDFKGKVVILDFWFKGCFFCAQLEKRMKGIRQHFAQDTKVVFVSVNVDNDKNEFLKGLASGLYTGKDEVNLFTGGAAFDHPLVKYYRIIGCPEMVIIDKKQRTFYSKPPRPVDEVSDKNFVRIIQKAEKLPD